MPARVSVYFKRASLPVNFHDPFSLCPLRPWIADAAFRSTHWKATLQAGYPLSPFSPAVSVAVARVLGFSPCPAGWLRLRADCIRWCIVRLLVGPLCLAFPLPTGA